MKTDIDIFLTSQTRVNRAEVERWLRRVGVSEDYELPPPGAATDAALAVALAGKRCYNSFEPGLNPNVTKIRADLTAYLDNVLASGHGSVLEHAVFTFAVEGVTRVFTAEMNRHRAGWAVSEASMRYIRFGEAVPYWEPDSIQGPDVLEEWDCDVIRMSPPALLEPKVGLTVDQKRHASRLIFERAFAQMRDNYRLLEKFWADELKADSKFAGKKAVTSMMRRVVGMGSATGGVWTGNARSLRHVIALRAAPEAEEEIAHVFGRIAELMAREEPMLFGDFTQVGLNHWVPRYKKV